MIKKNLLNFERFFSLFPVHIYMIDTKGYYQSCNESQALDFGLESKESIVGLTNYDLPALKNHTHVIELLEKNNNRVFNTGKPFEFYEPFPKFDDTFGQCKSHKIPIFEHNQLIGLIGLSYDLSEETKQLNELKSQIDQNELTLSNIIDNLPEHIYWLDKNNVFLGCNAQQARDFGLKNSSEIIGLHVSNFQTKENAQAIIENNSKIIKNGQRVDAQENFLNNEGENVFYLSKKVPLKNKSNDVVGILGISFDITAQKKMEETLRKAKEISEAASHAKTEFLENIRHDIRTPLSGIVGFSEILKHESNEPRIKEYAENLIASSHALLSLMDEVLEAVRVSSGEIPMLKRKFNLAETLEQIVALNCARAAEKRLNFSLELDKNIPQYVIGDKIRLHRIVLELVGNALNFTDIGHVTISVNLAKRENQRLVIKVTVSDSGMGIPKDKQHEIYLQFKRLTPSYQGIYKGAGLGLYVIKQFIDELGGEIYVESEPHKGTVFTCLIPLQEPLLDDASGIDLSEDLKTDKPYMFPLKNQTPTQEPLSESKTTVLVVEDNFIAQTVAKTLLSALDCQVDVASNGADAITLCEQNHYDLIFMDIGLGDEMDGYEVTNRIRNASNETKNTPIIALTAHGGEENKQRCIQAGMNAVLTKPLTKAHATDIIKSFISSRYETHSTESTKVRRDIPDNNEELFQIDQFPLFDREDALKNCGTSNMLSELIILMTTELPIDLQKMKNAFENQDYALVEKTAHKIKGGAVYVGTMRLKYACQYVERYLKSGERELFDALYHQAVSTIEETLIYIDGWYHTVDRG